LLSLLGLLAKQGSLILCLLQLLPAALCVVMSAL
jgi:hypothetical protein